MRRGPRGTAWSTWVKFQASRSWLVLTVATKYAFTERPVTNSASLTCHGPILSGKSNRPRFDRHRVMGPLSSMKRRNRSLLATVLGATNPMVAMAVRCSPRLRRRARSRLMVRAMGHSDCSGR
ncbi:hypothetical protein GCM10020295_15340 [Streptomyces cinereospinus]